MNVRNVGNVGNVPGGLMSTMKSRYSTGKILKESYGKLLIDMFKQCTHFDLAGTIVFSEFLQNNKLSIYPNVYYLVALG